VALKLVPLKQKFCGRLADLQQIITKDYNLLDPAVARPTWQKSMSIPSFGTSGGKIDALVDITWDERETTFNQALITWSAHYFVGIYAQRAAEARIYVNDSLVAARGWQASEGCQTKGNMEGLNIGAYIKNGTNKFTIELVGSWSPEVSGVDNITGFLVAEFVGKEPNVKPTPPEWLTYVKWGAVALGILGAVYIGIKVYQASKKG
jgi:hypothetical protein